jgi:peroxiredoxin
MKWRSLQESEPESGSRRLYEIFAERRELIARYVPAEIQAIHAKAVEELKQAGAADKALKSGDPAPEFELPDQNGKVVRSADLVARGPVVICFIRGRWCPFCVGQMEAMNAVVPELEKLGASLVAVSPQTVHQSFLMADQHQLQFPVLSDAGNQVARKFGLVYRVREYQQDVYRRAFVNLPFLNGDESWELPIPATYIVGTTSLSEPKRGSPSPELIPEHSAGTACIYSSVNPDYTERPEPLDLLAQLRHLFS